MPPNRTRRRCVVRWFRSTSNRSWRKIRRSANLGPRSRKKFRKIDLAAFAIDGRRTHQIRTRNTDYNWRRWSYSFFWFLAMPENCLFCLWLWNKVIVIWLSNYTIHRKRTQYVSVCTSKRNYKFDDALCKLLPHRKIISMIFPYFVLQRSKELATTLIWMLILFVMFY